MRSGTGRVPRHDLVEQLPVADHAILLARDALLRRGVGPQRLEHLLEGIHLDAQAREPLLLVTHLAPEGEEVPGAVLTALDGEGDGTQDEGEREDAPQRRYSDAPG